MAGELTVNPTYGAALGGTWVPAPRYVLRRARILRAFSRVDPGAVYEVGCGAGGVLRDLAQRGFNCTGVDSSEAARDVASKLLAGTDVRLAASLDELSDASQDHLLSCEVLEHVEDDRAALADWLRPLKPGGSVVIAVPAHQRSFGPLDAWAGQLRRYDRKPLQDLLAACNVRPVHWECYGFPLANVTSFVRNFRLRDNPAPKTPEELAAATAKSGIDRSDDLKIYEFQKTLPGRALMASALALQSLFLRTNLGDGFLVVGRYEP